MSADNGEIRYIHAFDGCTDEQLMERRQYYSDLYYQKYDELAAVECARDAISQLIRERRRASREAGTEAAS